ncbi:hypothetical protein BCR36DRAFT_276944 [Piromyces finnis]|uniref:SUEL-type lectin domain-containing protein n=1 Tax=Piromyces finnis TaxID=1754191 RepID=A0A1Y1VK38_9FUNG|nr:hypothetical protein BCR36DRAFT_276944 [Piromyces finnis]|eukprot:ORX58452.1 hypothetical protein BCR36DRAFT_276944 [Piromyces finnis]
MNNKLKNNTDVNNLNENNTEENNLDKNNTDENNTDENSTDKNNTNENNTNENNTNENNTNENNTDENNTDENNTDEDNIDESNIYVNNTLKNDINDFDSLEEVLPLTSKYLCELKENQPYESQKGYVLSCPSQYTISVNYTFYGRYANDIENCETGSDNRYIKEDYRYTEVDCGYDPIRVVKDLCEGKEECTLKPYNDFFENRCGVIYKYLHIKYQCIKNKEFKKPRIALVKYHDQIKSNTEVENSISEAYQYSKIHGYEFQLYSERYDTERAIYYMKLHSILESLIIGLKEKKYDWIFWSDADTIISNPNIKLETFLPPDEMNQIHLVIASDYNGLNSGIFLLRVHPWSLNMIIRSLSYYYYNPYRLLKFHDQSSQNNVLTKSDEKDHYIIVPQYWFNRYYEVIDGNKGGFLIHLAGVHNKANVAKIVRLDIMKNIELYTSKTNEELRDEILQYYNLPREDQNEIYTQF